MERPHLRPRVSLFVPEPADAVCERLAQRLEEAGDRLEGRVRHTAVLVWIGETRRRWWSPCLDLMLKPARGGTEIVGYYAAHPRWMTATVFLSILLTLLGSLSATWAWVQHTMGESPHCLMGTSGTIAGGVLLWAAHRVGQRWSASQMHELAWVLEGLGEVRVDEAQALTPA